MAVSSYQRASMWQRIPAGTGGHTGGSPTLKSSATPSLCLAGSPPFCDPAHVNRSTHCVCSPRRQRLPPANHLTVVVLTHIPRSGNRRYRNILSRPDFRHSSARNGRLAPFSGCDCTKADAIPDHYIPQSSKPTGIRIDFDQTARVKSRDLEHPGESNAPFEFCCLRDLFFRDRCKCRDNLIAAKMATAA